MKKFFERESYMLRKKMQILITFLSLSLLISATVIDYFPITAEALQSTESNQSLVSSNMSYGLSSYSIPQEFPNKIENVTIYHQLEVAGNQHLLINDTAVGGNITIWNDAVVFINNSVFYSNLYYFELHGNSMLIIKNSFTGSKVLYISLYDNAKLIMYDTMFQIGEVYVRNNAELYINDNFHNGTTRMTMNIFDFGNVFIDEYYSPNKSLTNYAFSVDGSSTLNITHSDFNQDIDVTAYDVTLYMDDVTANSIQITGYSTNLTLKNCDFTSGWVDLTDNGHGYFNNVSISSLLVSPGIWDYSAYAIVNNSEIQTVNVLSGAISYFYNSNITDLTATHLIYGSVNITNGVVHMLSGLYKNSTELDAWTASHLTSWVNDTYFYLLGANDSFVTSTNGYIYISNLDNLTVRSTALDRMTIRNSTNVYLDKIISINFGIYIDPSSVIINNSLGIPYVNATGSNILVKNTSITSLDVLDGSVATINNVTFLSLSARDSNITILNTIMPSAISSINFDGDGNKLFIKDSCIPSLSIVADDANIIFENNNFSETASLEITNSSVSAKNTFMHYLYLGSSSLTANNISVNSKLEVNITSTADINDSLIESLTTDLDSYAFANYSTINEAWFHIEAINSDVTINDTEITVHSSFNTTFEYANSAVNAYKIYNLTVVNSTLNLINFDGWGTNVFSNSSTVNVDSSNVSGVYFLSSTINFYNTNFTMFMGNDSNIIFNQSYSVGSSTLTVTNSTFNVDDSYINVLNLFYSTFVMNNSEGESIMFVNSSVTIDSSIINDVIETSHELPPFMQNSTLVIKNTTVTDVFMQAYGSFSVTYSNILDEFVSFPANCSITDHTNITNLYLVSFFKNDGTVINNAFNGEAYNTTTFDATSKAKTILPAAIVVQGSATVNVSNSNLFYTVAMDNAHLNIETLNAWILYLGDSATANLNVSLGFMQPDGAVITDGNAVLNVYNITINGANTEHVFDVEGNSTLYLDNVTANNVATFISALGTSTIHMHNTTITQPTGIDFIITMEENSIAYLNNVSIETVMGIYTMENSILYVNDSCITVTMNVGPPVVIGEDYSKLYFYNVTTMLADPDQVTFWPSENSYMEIHYGNMSSIYGINDSMAKIYDAMITRGVYVADNADFLLQNSHFMDYPITILVGYTHTNTGPALSQESSSKFTITNASVEMVSISGNSYVYAEDVFVAGFGTYLYYSPKFVGKNFTVQSLAVMDPNKGFIYGVFRSAHGNITLDESTVTNTLAKMYRFDDVGTFSISDDVLILSNVNFTNQTNVANTNLAGVSYAYGFYIDGLINYTISDYGKPPGTNKGIGYLYTNSSTDPEPPVIVPSETYIEFEEDMNIPLLNFTLYEEFPDKYEIYYNGSLVESGSYTNGTVISVNVTDFPVGKTIIQVCAYSKLPTGMIFVTVMKHRGRPPMLVYYPPGYFFTMLNKTHRLLWNYTDDWKNNIYRRVTVNGSVELEDNSTDDYLYYDFRGNKTGLYIVELTLIDTAGHKTVNSTKIYVDDTIPYFTDTQKSTYVKAGATATLSWTATDKYPGNYTIFVNGSNVASGDWTSGSPITYDFSETIAGVYNVTILIYDKPGYKQTTSVFIYVDDDVPQFTSEPENASITTEEEILLNWTAIDTYPDNYTIYVDGNEVDSGAWINGMLIQYAFSSSEAGTHNITVVVTDKVGNTAISTVFVVVTEVQPSLLPDLTTLGLGIGIIILIAIGVLYYLRKRRRKQ